MIAAVRQALSLLPKGRGWLWLTVVAFAILASLTEAMTAGFVFQLIRVIDNPAGFIDRVNLDFLRTWSHRDLMWGFTLLTMGFYGLRSLMALVEVYVQTRLVNQEAANLSVQLLNRYAQAPYAFHLQRNSSEMLHKVFQDIRNGLVITLLGITGIASEIFMILALVGVLFIISPWLTLGILGFLGTLLILLVGPVQHWVQRWGQKAHDVSQEAYRHLQQLLLGLKEVRVAGREAHFVDEFARHERNFRQIRSRLETFGQAPRTVIEILFSLVAGGAIYYMLAHNWPTEQIVSLLGVYVYVVFRVMPALNRLSSYMTQIRYYQTAVQGLSEELKTLESLYEAEPPALRSGNKAVFQQTLELQGICYTYPGKEEQSALQQINLTIQRGDFVGIVGTTGAGKSTLVDILLGVLTPQEGMVLVDGADIRQDLRAWQDQIGYVPQNIYLLDDTLAANIYFGTTHPDECRLYQVIQMAQLDGLVRSLPQGVKTLVGEQGIRLSGGERQRIAIARALYHDPAVLIFDEATASLDNETERKITDTVLGIRGEKTIFMIAHRLSTVESCDRLILLKEGQIAAIDAYQDLLRYQTDFQKLVGAA